MNRFNLYVITEHVCIALSVHHHCSIADSIDPIKSHGNAHRAVSTTLTSQSHPCLFKYSNWFGWLVGFPRLRSTLFSRRLSEKFSTKLCTCLVLSSTQFLRCHVLTLPNYQLIQVYCRHSQKNPHKIALCTLKITKIVQSTSTHTIYPHSLLVSVLNHKLTDQIDCTRTGV